MYLGGRRIYLCRIWTSRHARKLFTVQLAILLHIVPLSSVVFLLSTTMYMYIGLWSLDSGHGCRLDKFGQAHTSVNLHVHVYIRDTKHFTRDCCTRSAYKYTNKTLNILQGAVVQARRPQEQ